MTAVRLLLSGYSGQGPDIHLVSLDGQGRFAPLAQLRHGGNPSFLCQAGETIYAAGEREEAGDITAYRLEETALRPIAHLALPGKGALCHLTAAGDHLLGSCYGSGHFFAVDRALQGVAWCFQPPGTPRAHWMLPWGRTLLCADLGNDCLRRFTLRGGLPGPALAPWALPPGSGPRQPLPLPGGAWAVICEGDGKIRLLDPDGTPYAQTPASAAPGPNAPGGACRQGDVLFVANRGPNTLAAFQLAPAGLTPLGEWPTGDWPRFLCYLPGLRILLAACNRGGEVRAYRWEAPHLVPLSAYPLPGASCALAVGGAA